MRKLLYRQQNEQSASGLGIYWKLLTKKIYTKENIQEESIKERNIYNRKVLGTTPSPAEHLM